MTRRSCPWNLSVEPTVTPPAPSRTPCVKVCVCERALVCEIERALVFKRERVSVCERALLSLEPLGRAHHHAPRPQSYPLRGKEGACV